MSASLKMAALKPLWKAAFPLLSQGITSTPPHVAAEIQSLTPLPTADAQSIIVNTILNHVDDAESFLQKLTGFEALPGGFSQVSSTLHPHEHFPCMVVSTV